MITRILTRCRPWWAFAAGLTALLPLLWPARLLAHAEPCALLTHDPKPAEGFGFSLDAEGNLLAVGAPGNDGQRGAVYIYERAGNIWNRKDPPLQSPSVIPGERFGFSVSLSGNTLAVGAPLAGGSGVVYIFQRTDGTWNPTPFTLVTTGLEAGDQFGFSVALEDDWLAVGAPFDDDGGSLAGSVYVFQKLDPGWVRRQKLLSPENRAADQFGFSVALQGPRLVVTAPFADNPPNRRNFGIAFVFHRNGEVWTYPGNRDGRLTAGDFAENDAQFGSSVAIDGDVIVGARGEDGDVRGIMNRGAAYLFRPNGSGWMTPLRLTPIDSEWGDGDQMGWSVAIAGNTVAAGAPFHRVDTQEPGAGFVFISGAFSKSVTGMDASADSQFGAAVAVSGDMVLVGGYRDDQGFPDAGSVIFCKVGPPSPCTKMPSIDKTGPAGPVDQGSPISYTVTVTNHCPESRTVRLKDDFDDDKLDDVGWEQVGEQVEGPGPCEPDHEGDLDEEVTLPAGEEGKVSYCVKAKVGDSATGVLVNKACISMPGLGEVCDEVRNRIRPSIRPPKADLAINKTGPASAKPGDTITYKLTIKNQGPDTATGVRLDDPIPEELQLVGSSRPNQCRVANDEFSCELGDLAPHQTIEVSLDVKIDPKSCASTIMNQARVSANEEDLNPNNNVSESVTSLVRMADLKLEKTGPACINPGNPISYSLKITNLGPDCACGLQVRDPVPSDLLSPAFPPGCEVIEGREVVCSIDKLCSGDPPLIVPLNFTVAGAAPPNSKIINTATVNAGAMDPNSNNNSAMTMSTVGCCKLTILKTADATTAMPGQMLHYTIVASNPSGEGAAATVDDFFPMGLTTMRWCRDTTPIPCTPTTAGDIHELISLPAGGSATFRARAIVDIKFTGKLSNTASVTAPSCTGASATVETEIGFTGIKAFCTEISGQLIMGSIITKKLVLINGGPADQFDNPGDEFTDTLPPGLTLTGVSVDPPASGTAAMVGNTATWNGAIPIGGMVMITITATITAPAGTTLCNQATISFDANGDGINDTNVLSDDPHLPGDMDPCCFRVLFPEEIPALSTTGLLALAVLLAALALLRLSPRSP